MTKVELEPFSKLREHSDYIAWMSDPTIIKYLETRFYPQSKHRLESYLIEQNSRSDIVFLAIVAGGHVGNIKLGPIDWIHRCAEIGLVLGKGYWGKGYGTEAIALIVDHAFNKLNLHKLTAGAYAENIASIRIFEKNGFVQEGCIKSRYYLSEGKRTDKILLGLINPREAP